MRRLAMCVRGARALLDVAARLAGLALVFAACAHVRPCDGISCSPACPRDSAPSGAGGCACSEGDVPLFGACVPPSVADAFCGPAAVVDSLGNGASGGCVFRSCGSEDALDLSSGACVRRGALPHGGSIACSDPALPIVEEGRPLCASPPATCPRGSTPVAGAKTCARPPGCPPGALPDGSSCRAIVTTDGRSGHAGGPRVDIGAWTVLALGVNGGPGSPALCQPLAQRPDLLETAGGGAQTVRIALELLMPDEDVSRLHAELETRDATGREVAPAIQALVSRSVSTLLELLRSLGGEASTAVVELEVTCQVGI